MNVSMLVFGYIVIETTRKDIPASMEFYVRISSFFII